MYTQSAGITLSLLLQYNPHLQGMHVYASIQDFWCTDGLCADVEFGRLQARDLLQHLWTGPISNAPVNIVQGSKSVEVRPVGISKVRLIMVSDLGVAVLIDP